MFLTVLLSVTAFVVYNVAISMGSMSNRVFFVAMNEIPLEFAIAFLLESLLAFRLSEKLAFKVVKPETDRAVVVILAITCATICIMCPSMSLAATILYDGFTPEFLSNWLRKIVYNFPFAFFSQIFLIGPVVSSDLQSCFQGKCRRYSRLTVRS
jgi:hypothetical protein